MVIASINGFFAVCEIKYQWLGVSIIAVLPQAWDDATRKHNGGDSFAWWRRRPGSYVAYVFSLTLNMNGTKYDVSIKLLDTVTGLPLAYFDLYKRGVSKKLSFEHFETWQVLWEMKVQIICARNHYLYTSVMIHEDDFWRIKWNNGSMIPSDPIVSNRLQFSCSIQDFLSDLDATV